MNNNLLPMPHRFVNPIRTDRECLIQTLESLSVRMSYFEKTIAESLSEISDLKDEMIRNVDAYLEDKEGRSA